MSTCDTPIWISSSSVPRSRARTTRRSRPQRDERDRDDGQRRQDPDDPPAEELADRELGDRDHVGSSRSASSSRKAASSDPRPGSTAWTRPPPATSAATRSGIRSAAQRPDRQPLPVDGRRAEGGRDRPARVGQVGHPQANAVDGDDLVERAGRDRAAVVEDDDPVAHPLDLGQQVRVEDDRRSPVARRADDGPDVRPAERVERRGRLVEEHELRVPEQRDAQPEPLLHPLREAAHRVVGTIGQADPVERLVDDSPSVGGGDPAEPRVEREDLAGVQPGLVAEELGQVADPRPRRAVAERARRGRDRSPPSAGPGRAGA